MHTTGQAVRPLRTGTLLAVIVATTASAETPLTSRRVATGLSRPVFVTARPGDTSRVFIVEQRGSAGVANRADIRILNLATGTISATPFLTVTGVSTESEQGLLGMAFAPDYETSGRFYVDFTTANGDTLIARGTVSADPDVANPALETILTIDQPDTNHNGGCLQFGPDAYLYISSGDGGGVGDPSDNGQDLAILLGKILRLDVSPDTGYAIPPDNPYVDTNGLDEI